MPTRRAPVLVLYWMSSMSCLAESVGMLRHRRPAAAEQEIEIAAFVRLQHVIEVQARIPGPWLRLLAGGALRKALDDLCLGHVEMQAPGRAIELDEVAIAHDAQRPARHRFGRDVQHH